MSFNSPHWLNGPFFDKVIKSYTKDNEAKVVDFSIKPGSKPGENFASAMYRVDITFKKSFSQSDWQSMSVIIKTLPVEDSMEKQLTDNSPLFKTEMKMYGETLVDVKAILKASGDNTQLFPRLIYQALEPTTVIVLEDISVNGYETLRLPKDYQTSKLIFQRLAKFHAASFCLVDNGADFTSYNYSVYHMPEFIQKCFFQHNLSVFKKLIVENTWPKFNTEQHLQRIDQVIEHCTERGKRIYSPGAGGFNVLNHGDFVMRNMLFQKSNDKISDVQFMMGYKKAPPTLLDLNVELTRCGPLAAQMSICYMPYLFAEWHLVDSNAMFAVNDDTENFKRSLYLNPEFKEFIEEEFEDFFMKGFI
ncbi:unnamed protein product [Diamesa hyperborea]